MIQVKEKRYKNTWLRRKELIINFISSEFQVADLFTKPLPCSRFHSLVSSRWLLRPSVWGRLILIRNLNNILVQVYFCIILFWVLTTLILLYKYLLQLIDCARKLSRNSSCSQIHHPCRHGTYYYVSGGIYSM